MKSFRNCFIVLSLFAFVLAPVLTTGQATTGESTASPPEFSPSSTARARAPRNPLAPQAKFRKTANAILNKYIVVLNDDVVSGSAAKTRRAKVSSVAKNLAGLHGGKVGFVYETAVKGFSVELPGEGAAVALSHHPQVKFVEEEGRFYPSTIQYNPPWGLDRIDQMPSALDNQYVYDVGRDARAGRVVDVLIV